MVRIVIRDGFQCDCSGETVFVADFRHQAPAVEFVKKFLSEDIVVNINSVSLYVSSGAKKIGDALAKILERRGLPCELTVGDDYVSVWFGTDELALAKVKYEDILTAVYEMLDAIMEHIKNVISVEISVDYEWGGSCGTAISIEKRDGIFEVAVGNQDWYREFHSEVKHAAAEVLRDVGSDLLLEVFVEEEEEDEDEDRDS